MKVKKKGKSKIKDKDNGGRVVKERGKESSEGGDSWWWMETKNEIQSCRASIIYSAIFARIHTQYCPRLTASGLTRRQLHVVF